MSKLERLTVKEMQEINGGGIVKAISQLVKPLIDKFNEVMDYALGRGRYAR